MNASPFNLDDNDTYQKWREQKLKNYPTSLGDLLVEIKDPYALSKGEKEALLTRCNSANMVLYQTTASWSDGQPPLLAIMTQLGITQADRHEGAGPNPFSALSPGGSKNAQVASYIPYRAAAIGWHTDGYYHPMDHQIKTLTLFCERQASEGGENELLDHEIAYIHLRDRNPDFIRALSHNSAMTIPARMDNKKMVRPERTGPVFSVDPTRGTLHMRFTSRTISIRWQDDDITQQAVQTLKEILTLKPCPQILRGRLAKGWGLISSNVLHTRSPFHDQDEANKRLLYRIRFFDRL